MYDDVTDNGILAFKEKSVFTTLLRRYHFCSFHLSHETTCYSYRHIRATCETKKGGMRMRMRLSNAEKDLKGEFTGCVFDAFLVEWSLNSCKFQVCNSFFLFLKILLRETRVNWLVGCSNKTHIHDTLVHMHGL